MRAYEAKSSKRPDYPRMGPLDSIAQDRAGRPHRKRFLEILYRASGFWIAAAGFSVPRKGQMADHSHLAAARAARFRSLDHSRPADRTDAPAATGASEIQRHDHLRGVDIRASCAQSDATN